jgi:hypothetical protein
MSRGINSSLLSGSKLNMSDAGNNDRMQKLADKLNQISVISLK